MTSTLAEGWGLGRARLSEGRAGRQDSRDHQLEPPISQLGRPSLSRSTPTSHCQSAVETLGPQTRQVFAKCQRRAQHVRISLRDVGCRKLRAGRDLAGPLVTPAATLSSDALCQHEVSPVASRTAAGQACHGCEGHPSLPSDWIRKVRQASGHRAPLGPPHPRLGSRLSLGDVTRSPQLACPPVGDAFSFLYGFGL